MKKMLSLISALTMCAVMAAPVASSAAALNTTEGVGDSSITYGIKGTENTPENERTSDVTFKKFKASSYVVTIPDGVADLSSAQELKVSAKDVLIGAKQMINISVTSANEFNLVNTDSKEKKVSYTLTPKVAEGDTPATALTNESEPILSIAPEEAYDEAVTKTLIAVASDDTIKVAGTYVDTLTFTVSVDGGDVTPMTDTELEEYLAKSSSEDNA